MKKAMWIFPVLYGLSCNCQALAHPVMGPAR